MCTYYIHEFLCGHKIVLGSTACEDMPRVQKTKK